MPVLRDGSTVDDPRFDRLFEHDERNQQFPVTARLSIEQTVPLTKTWPLGLWLDQGKEGACVGFGYAHEAAAEPVPVPGITNTYARDTIYWGVQRIDPWPGGSYPGASPVYEGTSVLSGAKWMTRQGYYSAYHWAFSEPEVALAISYLGPVVLGVNWYSGMFHPDTNGFLNPTGNIVGGHCILAIGYNRSRRSYILHNSWGRTWGRNGTAKISAATMAKLLGENGDACVPEGRKLVAV